MKTIRIGNDISLNWLIRRGTEAENFPDDTTIKLVDKEGSKQKFDYTLTNGTVSGTFYGKDQHTNGTYRLELIENEGKQNMVTLDFIDCFILSNHLKNTTSIGSDPSTITTETINVTSTISTIDCYTKAETDAKVQQAQDNSYAYTNTKTTTVRNDAYLYAEYLSEYTKDIAYAYAGNLYDFGLDESYFYTNEKTTQVKDDAYAYAESQAISKGYAYANEARYDAYAYADTKANNARTDAYAYAESITGNVRTDAYAYAESQAIEKGTAYANQARDDAYAYTNTKLVSYVNVNRLTDMVVNFEDGTTATYKIIQ